MSNNSKREKTPSLLQMDNAECGAVVLAIILAYFGRYIPISEAREACDVSRDGSKAINIIKAARHYGLNAHGMQLTLEQTKQLPPPFIVYWQFNHFLIVEGFNADKVYLNDPATGPRTINAHEFAQGYTGIVLFMDPGPEFQPEGKPGPSIGYLVWQYIVGTRSIFLFILISGLFLSAPVIGLAFFTKLFFDTVLLQQSAWTGFFVFGLLIIGLLIISLTTLRRFFTTRFYMKLKLSVVVQFFYRLLHLPINFFLQRAAGDLVERTETPAQIAHILAEKIASHLVDFINLMILVTFMFFISWPLALINIACGIIGIFLNRLLATKPEINGRLLQSIGKLSGIEINGIQIIETLKVNAVESHFFNLWANAHAEKVANEQALAIAELKRQIAIVSLWGFNLLALFGVGVGLIFQGQLSPGSWLASLVLFLAFIQPLNLLASSKDQLHRLKSDMARIDDVKHHRLENILSAPQNAVSLQQASASTVLEFKNVLFGYSRLEPPIFTDISFELKAGERLAIVGPTGGGKSSAAKLICGLYTPWSGEIIINGVPLPHTSRQQLAEYVGLVDQEIYLFSATLRENLTLWDSQISDSQIYHALSLACMDEIVRQRGGLDCWVEERGKNFSGGQVQRLEIARALIANPKLLILDEATSALDPLLEQQIYRNLQQQHCSLIIIAHRLSAIRDCHSILVIDQGQIIQRGKHEELMAADGLYKELVSLEIQ